MKQKRIYICMENQGYGKRLERYIAEQNNPCIEVELLTEMKDKINFDRQDFVISDKETFLADLNCQSVLLAKQAVEDGGNKIFMYQGRTEVYKQLLRIIGSEFVEEECQGENENSKVVCIFSPEGGDTKTLLAVDRALKKTGRERVLYISLCGFPVFFQEEISEKPDLGREGVSELLLCANSDMFCRKLEELAFTVGSISMIAPAGHYKDLFDYSLEEILNFMEHLKEQDLYDTVIIETGQLFEYTFDLLECADEVIVPGEPGFFAAVKRHVLHEYCLMEGREVLWNRIKFEEISSLETKDTGMIKKRLLEKGGTRLEEPGGKVKKGKNKAIGAGSGPFGYGDW